MRIGIDARAKTGIGRYAKELISRLMAIDHENEYVLFLNELLFNEIQVTNPRIKKILVRATYYSFAEQLILPLQILRERIDLMHFLHFSVPILYRKPFIVTIHDLTLSFFPGKSGAKGWISQKIYNIVIKNAARKAAHVIAVSHNTKKDLVQITHIPAEKISVIYEGCDTNRFFKITDKKQISDYRALKGYPEHMLFYVGVWRNHKNVMGLVRAFNKLKTEHHIPHKLLIGGEEDPRYPEIKQEVARLGLDKQIIMPGFIPDDELCITYNASDLFVFPSFYEGFGLPPLEALQCGTPVASSNTSSMPEILGNMATYFNPSDVDDMAKQIFRALTDDELRNSQFEHAQEFLKRYNWNHMAQETLACYRKEGNATYAPR